MVVRMRLMRCHMDEMNDGVYYEAYRKVRVRAVCPFNHEHRARVVSTAGKIRKCKCLTCGHRFKMVGPSPEKET